MESGETLREKYNEGLKIADNLKLVNVKTIYAVGFYAGQMEKVVSGACQFCMFRPDKEDENVLFPVISKLAETFGLYRYILQYFDDQLNQKMTEAWIFTHPDDYHLVENLTQYNVNSCAWHIARATLCGIPAHLIDPRYHLRSGHAKTKSTSG